MSETTIQLGRHLARNVSARINARQQPMLTSSDERDLIDLLVSLLNDVDGTPGRGLTKAAGGR